MNVNSNRKPICLATQSKYVQVNLTVCSKPAMAIHEWSTGMQCGVLNGYI